MLRSIVSGLTRRFEKGLFFLEKRKTLVEKKNHEKTLRNSCSRRFFYFEVLLKTHFCEMKGRTSNEIKKKF